MLHARYGAVPPEAVIVCEMAVPTNPPAIDGALANGDSFGHHDTVKLLTDLDDSSWESTRRDKERGDDDIVRVCDT